ncbi:hypothetical protein B0H11DRAFT_2072118 [Mycena galericulata]|nr:hypothetical protein B0H11DRAFT_2072118 [Mycena galericulata]
MINGASHTHYNEGLSICIPHQLYHLHCMASDKSLGIASEAIRIVVEPNTFVIIGGTALGGDTKRLTVLRGADQWQLTGEDQVLTHENMTYLSFQPVNEKIAYIFLLEAAKSGTDFVESEYARDFKATKHVVPDFATYYTIHTEDGEGNNFHDITLTVALIGASKGNNARTGVAPITSESPSVAASTRQNDSRAFPTSRGVDNRNLLVPTRGSTLDNSRGSVGNGSARPRKVSTGTRGLNSSASSKNTVGPTDVNAPVVTSGLNAMSVGVKTDTDIPTGTFILRNVYTNCELTAVIDTSPAMMFPTGQVPVEWRTWKIAVDGSGRLSMSNQVKTQRYLQDGATLVETGNPSPVRLIRANTQSQECWYISTDQSANQTMVLSDASPPGVPGGKIQTNVLEIDAPQQLWILVPVA